MVKKSELKLRVKKLKKRAKHLNKIVKIGVKSIKEKEGKIAQLTSVLDLQGKPQISDVTSKRHK